MKKNVFMILFVMFVMSSFTLVKHQPLQQTLEQTELAVDNHSYDVAITNTGNHASFELKVTEGVAISTGGEVSQTIIEANGLNVNNKSATIVEYDSFETQYGVVAVQQTRNKDYYIKRGRVEDYSIYAEWLVDKTFLNVDLKEKFIKYDDTYLKIDGTAVRQLNNTNKQV